MDIDLDYCIEQESTDMSKWTVLSKT